MVAGYKILLCKENIIPKHSNKVNKLTIYLIKLGYNTPETIIKDVDKLDKENLMEDDSLILFTEKSIIKSPLWIKNFFLKSPEEYKLKTASSKALLLIKLTINESDIRLFAIPFGMGFHLLETSVYEERFGLKIVLNSLDENQLRSVDKKNMSGLIKHSREQIGTKSNVTDFGIDIEQDLIVGITGKSKIETFGNTITGKDSFQLSCKANINSISDLLGICYSYFIKDDYKKNFGWVDQINEIRDNYLKNTLDCNLLDKIKEKKFEKLWMAVPEIIDWNDIEGFHYSYNTKTDKIDDIGFDTFLKGCYENEDFSSIELNILKNKKVLCYNSGFDFPKYKWSVYNCIYCEIVLDGLTYLLSNGKWYQIQNDFVEQIEREYCDILHKPCSITLPDFQHDNEGLYNVNAVESNLNYFLMDKKNIIYGGGYSRVEFCDIYTNNRELIHVKMYGGSSLLSHLFNQGLVSGELFIDDQEFRNLVNEKLGVTFKIKDTSKINSSDYSIIYAIISNYDQELDIPFFSKVSLRNVKKRLERIGYNVNLIKINVKK